MNEAYGQLQFSGLKDRVANEASPPEPVHSTTRTLEIPLSRFATNKTTNTAEKYDKAQNVSRARQFYDSVGYTFPDEKFSCIEHSEAVSFLVPTDQLLPNQKPEKLDNRLGRSTAEMPPTAEAVITFYVHEIPKPKEQLNPGIDLIIFGGGSSDALSNIGLAAQFSRSLEKNPQLKGKVGRVIVLPHLAGATKTSFPVNPAMTKDFGPAAEVMTTALNQAGISLSKEVCLAGHSAGGNMAIMMAKALKEQNPNLQPRLLLLDPAIGENPNIDQEMLVTGILDPLRSALRRNENGERLTVVQALKYTFINVMNGWGTQEGPAGVKILLEIARGFPVLKNIFPFPYMKREAAAAGFRNELAPGDPNIELLSSDSSAEARTFLAENNIPITVVWVAGATTVAPLLEKLDTKSLQGENKRITKILESPNEMKPEEIAILKRQQEFMSYLLEHESHSRNQAFFEKVAELLLPGISQLDVIAYNGKSHFDVMWDPSIVSEALEKTLA